MDAFLRLFLPLYLALFLGAAFIWRSWVVYRRTGINPFVLGNSDSAHDFLGKIFRFVIVALILDVLLFAIWPGVHVYAGPLVWLQRPWIAIAGVVLLIASFLWIVVAQAQMGNAWRIGIDQERETDLVDSGVFGMSRNPIFLGMRFSLLGFFLALPDAVMLTIFVLGEVLIQVQVRLEEEHLAASHGEAYESYRRRVRRWL